MIRPALTIVLVLSVAGCAPKAFIHPTPGAVNQLADASQCDYEIEMAQRGIRVPYWYNNNQALGYTLGAVIGQAIRNDRLRTLCMQAKGYIAVPIAAGATPIGQPMPNLPSITPQSEFAPAAYSPPTAAPGRGDIGQAARAPIGATPTVAAGIKAESKWLVTAEGVAKVSGCNPPAAAMTSKGAGQEMFAVGCPNGTTMAIRCEIEGCRVLQ